MPTTIREIRISKASDALDKTLIPFGDGLSTRHLRIAAEAVVDALFTDHSMDHLTVPSAPGNRGSVVAACISSPTATRREERFIGMRDMEPINVKMKMADPNEVTALMVAAVHESGWASNQPDMVVADVVRSIQAAMCRAGHVIIQVDNDVSLRGYR